MFDLAGKVAVVTGGSRGIGLAIARLLAGRNAFAGGAAYNATKFGLIGFSEALMLEVRHDGVRVACVMPGSVATGFGGSAGGGDDWKLAPDDVAQVVGDLLAFPPRALPSLVEIRPSRPPRKA